MPYLIGIKGKTGSEPEKKGEGAKKSRENRYRNSLHFMEASGPRWAVGLLWFRYWHQPFGGVLPNRGFFCRLSQRFGDLLGGGSIQINDRTLTPYNGQQNPVPEPFTVLLMGIGLLGLVGYSHKRSQKS